MDRRINFFWHGPRIGAVHSACIRSFMRLGYEAMLHCYERPEDLPDGVEVFDAAQLMPKSELLFEKVTGSVALGADRYRYRMLQAGFGTYADCDIFLLRPLPEDPYLFGQQHNWNQRHACNNAVLRYPADSEFARQLVSSTADEAATAPWHSNRRKIFNRARSALGFPPSATQAPWGEWGPQLVSYWVAELGLQAKAQPIDVFYPLHYGSTDLLYDPGLSLADLVTPRTVAIHLCHKMLRETNIPTGCVIDMILRS